MSVIYAANISPTKAELLGTWLPQQSWFPGAADERLELVAAYRFDDPAGAVGIETHIIRRDNGDLLQVPLTYRGSEDPRLEAFLITPMEHSVLGDRWVYDATGDPVYVQELIRVLTAGETQTSVVRVADGVETQVPESITLLASGHLRGPESREDRTGVDEDSRIDHVADETGVVMLTEAGVARLERLLRPNDSEAPSPEHAELLGMLPGDHTPFLLAKLLK